MAVGTLTIDLIAKTARLESDMGKAVRIMQKRSDAMAKTARNAARLIGAAFAGIGFTSLVSDALKAGDQIQKLSIRLGASTEALSQYRHVAELTGVSFRTFTTGLQRSTRRISEAAKGQGEAVDALNELGLSAEKLNQLSPERQFELIADAMGKVESQSDKVRLAMKLFDTEGVALLQTMEGGSAALLKMREEADRLGLTLDREAVDGMAAANDAMTRMKASTTALANTLAVALGPTIASVAGWFREQVPAAVEVSVKAFQAFRHFILEIGQKVHEFLSTVALGAAAIADFVGADNVAKSLANTSKMYAQFSTDIEEIQHNFALASGESEKFEVNLGKQVATLNDVSGSTERAVKTTRELVKVDKEHNALLQERQGLIESLRTPQEEYNDKIERLFMLEREVGISMETKSRAIQQYARDLADATGANDNLIKQDEEVTKKASDAARDLGLTFSSAFEDAIINGEKFSDVLSGIEDDILRILARTLVTKPLANSLTGALSGAGGGGGGFGGMLSGIFGGLFGGGKAAGGPVAAGVPYMVGEQGPEMFVPRTPGQIVPNGRSAGGNTINVTVNAAGGGSGGLSPSQIAVRTGSAVDRAMRRHT